MKREDFGFFEKGGKTVPKTGGSSGERGQMKKKEQRG